MKTGRKELLSESARLALIENVPTIEAALDRILASTDNSTHACETCKLVVRHCFRDSQLAQLVQTNRRKFKLWLEEARQYGLSEDNGATSGTPG